MAYWILKVVLSPIFFLLWRVEIDGREHVPKHGPAVLAANHQSFCDSFFLPLVLRRRVTYVAKAEYFDDWKTAWFFRAAGQIPMNRGGGDASQRALDTAKEVLKGGGLLGIYPEGTRSPDVRLHRGHTGVARLAIGCGVPIIPVGIVGTRAIQPPGRRIMRPFHPVTVRFGPPLICSDAEASNGKPTAPVEISANGSGGESEQEVLRRWTDRLMHAIAAVSRQEYVDEYATRSKAGGSAKPDRPGPGPGTVPDAGSRSAHRPNAQGGAVDVAS
ncbi:MAG TPA: lysophospholipid acyltransferase family protein [Acidimicrobiales bacterium]|nr:lysophospholipid acyltransferase family protein [Acidimicrobiales bacterium]